ncbi:hypothetical protein AAF712_004515 [Marasmius tenuissimus]|uniref:Uncharacterized protein n=1 Tax=Marasmius tenuissimus TaxID=585030 RepID=A0ABR3A4V8_9AGAR
MFRYPQYAQHMLKLAKSTPLNLVWTDNIIVIDSERLIRSSEPVKLFLSAIAHPSGIASLRLQGREPILRFLLSQMIHPLPLLRSITIQYTSLMTPLSFPENFLGGNAPGLYKLDLDLSRFRVPWGSPILRNLRYLSMSYGARYSHLPDLIHGLQGLKHLETLHLRYRISGRDAYHSLDLGVRAELPRLRDFTAESSAVLHCSRLLESISFPRSTSLTLSCSVFPLAEDSHIEGLFNSLKGLFSQDVIDSPREALHMHINARSQGDDQAGEDPDRDTQDHLSRLSLIVHEDLNGSSIARGVRGMFGDLPYLERLSLQSEFEDEDELVCPLLDQSTLLTWVCLGRKAPVVNFLKALGRGLSQSSTGAVEGTVVFLPALKTFELHSVDFEGSLQLLLEVLVLRKKNGFPIEKLVLKDSCRMEGRHVEEIMGVVKIFNWDGRTYNS